MQHNWPTAQKEVVCFLVLEFLFDNVSCLVGLFLYYRIVGFEIFYIIICIYFRKLLQK